MYSSTEMSKESCSRFRSKLFASVQEWSDPTGRDKLTLEKKVFILYFYSDKLSHYKRYDFRKYLISDAFKHVRLQNTFNRCKVHQILPLTFDYAWFLVKCINYLNVMCLKIIYFFQDLARFLQKLHFWKKTTLAKFLQEMKKCCMIVAKILQDVLFTRIFQKLYWLQEFCKIFAKVVFLVN